MLAAATAFSPSFLRKQGPITTGLSGCAKVVEQRLSKQPPRRMDPGLRRHDSVAAAGISF
jgi:hypothetical protein